MAEVRLRSLLWDEANEAHIARHRVEPEEVEEVVFGQTAVFAVDDSHRVGSARGQGHDEGRSPPPRRAR